MKYEMKDKFRVNLSIALPAAILTIILLLIFGEPETVTNIDILNYNLLKILPYITVLVMAISGLNVFIVLTSGIIISGLIGIISRDFSFLSLHTFYQSQKLPSKAHQNLPFYHR